jgi:hypothetical protein
MRSHPRSLKVPHVLDEAIVKEICNKLGFENEHACWIGIGIMAVQIARMLPRIVAVANAKPKTQDFVLDKWLLFPTDLNGMLRELKKLNHKSM